MPRGGGAFDPDDHECPQSAYGVFVPRHPRRVTAKDYRSAYDHRARYFSDPAMMTGRDAALTQFKIANLVDRLPLSSTSRVLDIGPGDGALFRLIAHRVAACVGVDPSEHALAKLSAAFHDCPNVTFVLGACTDLPPADEPFDMIVINSVVHMLGGDDEVRRTLASIARLSASGGTVYVGEIPFRSERADGLATQLRTQVAHVGARRAARAVFEMYVRPVLRGEPMLVEPVGRTLDYSPDAFAALVRDAGFRVEVLPHLEPRGVSTTRKDYLLTRLA